MLNPKSTIYQTEWLDLVFANRNKSYGAYELRQNYNKRLAKALVISSTLMIFLVSFPLLQRNLLGSDDAPIDRRPVLDTTDVTLYKPPVKKIEKPAAATALAEESAKARTIKHTRLVAVSHTVDIDPPTLDQLKNAAIGQQTVDGPGTGAVDNVIPSGSGTGTGDGISAGTPDGNEVVSVALLEKNPEFPGGMEAFIKYLKKNLRYPTHAAESGVSGRVFVSFIVEKDGHLTDVKIVKGIGFGCDEEAARVLKKSPDWIPGVQNNRKVRVAYTIPLVFQMD